MVETGNQILKMLAQYSKPLTAGPFTSFLILSVLPIPLIINQSVWLIDMEIARIALVILMVEVLLSARVVWKAISQTLNPKVKSVPCPNCNVSMEAKNYSCPMYGWKFGE